MSTQVKKPMYTASTYSVSLKTHQAFHVVNEENVMSKLKETTENLNLHNDKKNPVKAIEKTSQPSTAANLDTREEARQDLQNNPKLRRQNAIDIDLPASTSNEGIQLERSGEDRNIQQVNTKIEQKTQRLDSPFFNLGSIRKEVGKDS